MEKEEEKVIVFEEERMKDVIEEDERKIKERDGKEVVD